MKGLLLKDLYLLKKYCGPLLLILCILVIMSVFSSGIGFTTIYPLLLVGVLPVTLISYDEREKWTQFSAVLPYTRAQLVSVKYIIGLSLTSLAALLMLAVQAAFGRFQPAKVFIFWALGLISPSIVLPLTFKLGAEKARIAVTCAVGIMSAASIIIAYSAATASVVNGAGITAVAAVIFAVSWLISIRIYQKREL